MKTPGHVAFDEMFPDQPNDFVTFEEKTRDYWERAAKAVIESAMPKLKRYEAREPLVQALLMWVSPRDGEPVAVGRDCDNFCVELGQAVRDFRLEDDR